MKYKLAIFDFDGTLADSFPFFLSTVNELADKHKFKRLNDADLEIFRRSSARKMMDQVGMPLWKLAIVGRSFKAIMAKNSDQIPLFAGVENMLHTLSRQGVVLSLVTSNSYENVRRILQPNNLDLMVHHQCGASLFGKATRLRKVLRATGIHPNDAIYIGDEIRDIEAAQIERINSGAVAWGYTFADALMEYSPSEMFSSMDDLIEKIAAH